MITILISAEAYVIPVEVSQTPWHYTTFWDWLDHWQTLIAGFLAFVAGVGTVVAAIWAIWATRSIAREQIAASRADADRVIAATREQTETTVQLEQERFSIKDRAFHVMLAAAMDRVLAEAGGARKTYPELMTPQAMLEAMGAGLEAGSSPDALAARQCITKGAFAELRAACVTQGGPALTGDFLDLERQIDSFASQWRDAPWAGITRREGKHAGLDEQLALIETKATELRHWAFVRLS